MRSKELEQNYQDKKNAFHKYVYKIRKKTKKGDIYVIINPTLVKNPYASNFVKNYFLNEFERYNKIFFLIKNLIKYYIKNVYLFFCYLINFIIFKLFYKKKRKNKLETIIDVFGLIDKTIEDEKFNDNYFSGLYKVFEKFKVNYTFLIRPYPQVNNIFKLQKFYKIINKDKRDFIFEYELLTLTDLIRLFILIARYPFQTLYLKQKEKNITDKMFNKSLVEDLDHFSISSLTRYLFGKNLSKIHSIKRIYSWCEFQVVERGFNYAIRKNCQHIELIGLQFYLNYEVYFNTYVDDLDYEMLSSPHKIFVNGKHYILKRKKIQYKIGVSLRYRDVFNFRGVKKKKNILLIGSYDLSVTNFMLRAVKKFNNIIFKLHPSRNLKSYEQLPNNIKISKKSIYKLFENSKLVITSTSGTAAEAVTCGIPVIIIASQNNFTANPLVKKGRGKLWDIVFELNEIYNVYKKLIDFKTNNHSEVVEIANWYKNNFFVEPTDENIAKVFELNKISSDN